MTGRWLAFAGCLALTQLLPAQNYDPPVPISRVEPVYPKLAKQARIEGNVRLSVAVDRDGTVIGVKLLKGHPLLVKAAMDAVKQWLFRPGIRKGVPVRSVTEVSLGFWLDGRPPDEDSRRVIWV